MFKPSDDLLRRDGFEVTVRLEHRLMLALAAVVLALVAVLPGSLGVVMLTHRVLARPAGALFFNVLSLPLWVASIAVLAVAAYRATQGHGSPGAVWVAVLVVGGLSVFGFFMHMRFMFRPVREPKYLEAEEALRRFGADEEVVGVLDRSGRPFAYISRLARRPHLVFQSEGEAPFVMSHCVLSHSSMAYEIDEELSGSGLHVTSVLANNLVFYDRKRHCTVLQVRNRSRDESYGLTTLPTLHASLASWVRFYPESKIWYRPREWRDTFYLKLLARASVVDPTTTDLVYPLDREPDGRLPLKEYVMGVHLNGEAKAFPLPLFTDEPVVQDVVGGEPLAFLASREADLVQLFSRRSPAGGPLDLEVVSPELFEDRATGTRWDSAGRCVAGEFEGERLPAIPHYNKIFWCVWANFFPETAIHRASERESPTLEAQETA